MKNQQANTGSTVPGLVALTVAFILAILLPSSCASFIPWTAPDDLSRSALQKNLDKAINEFSLPGLQAGYLQHGKSPVLAAAGTADYQRKTPAIDDHSSFRVGSTTKMFVAALICRLAEQGKLQLDSPIAAWFPDWPGAANITIKQLLSHTSGIKESLFTDPGILMGSMLEPAKIWQPSAVATVLARSARSRAATQPTTAPHAFTYANDNYILLGLIAEQVGGRPLAAQLAAEFFTPLGMTETTLLPWHPGSSVSPVAGYDEYLPFGPTLIEKTTTSWDSLTWAAGSLCSSSRDLLLWLDALFHNQVLKPETLAHMTDWTDARDNGRDNHMVQYGLGISRYELAGHSLLGHPGGGFGGECFPFWDPASDTAWVVVYNLSRKDNPAGTTLLARLLDSQPPK